MSSNGGPAVGRTSRRVLTCNRRTGLLAVPHPGNPYATPTQVVPPRSQTPPSTPAAAPPAAPPATPSSTPAAAVPDPGAGRLIMRPLPADREARARRHGHRLAGQGRDRRPRGRRQGAPRPRPPSRTRTCQRLRADAPRGARRRPARPPRGGRRARRGGRGRPAVDRDGTRARTLARRRPPGGHPERPRGRPDRPRGARRAGGRARRRCPAPGREAGQRPARPATTGSSSPTSASPRSRARPA